MSNLTEEQEEPILAGLENAGKEILERGVRVRFWIAIILAVLAVAIFSIMKYQDVVRPNLMEIAEKRERSALGNMEQHVQESLKGFGIKKDWIKKKDIRLPDHPKFRTEWEVYAPRDVPLASLNQELSLIAEEYDAKTLATEDLKSGLVLLHIIQNELLVFTIELIPDKSKTRSGGVIAILCDGLETAPEGEVDKLAASNEPIACVFEPTLDVYERYNTMKTEEKELIFHFHVNPEQRTERRFEFHEDMNSGSIRRRLRFLIQNYPDVGAYFITTELVPGSAAEIMEDELSSHGLHKVEIDEMVYLDRSLSEEQLSARINDLAAISAKRGFVIGVIKLKSGVIEFLTSEMIRLRKKGFDCYTLNQVLKYQKNGAR
jgi:polysaccharide deacetylase 2 family uncharacterized protein YibQ